MRVLVVHGPNLNLLGEREPDIYGPQTLAEIDASIAVAARELGIDVRCEQHNGEGHIIDALHAARRDCDAVVINPGAYSHYSYAIADAIRAIGIPVIEVHLSNIMARESFRRTSVTGAVCRATIGGLGASGYVLALRALIDERTFGKRFGAGLEP
jgi:3-dehydroquinate dehydratase-2